MDRGGVMVRIHGIGVLLLMTVLHSSAVADWPFWANDGIRRGSKEYYELKASDPPGSRQHYKAGKLWPPYPRPTGPHQTFVHKYHHTHYWPLPYVCADREVTRSYFETQAQNGWVEATTFYDYHFDPVSGELSTYGQQHLTWIVNNVPAQYQQLHLALSMDAKVNTERTRSIEQYLVKLPGADRSLAVQPRAATPIGRPGSEVQRIFKTAQDNMPPPILSSLTVGERQQSN